MANLDSLYDKVLNEAWSKTIAGNGKNTLLVHTQAEFKPEDTYYVFVCQQSRISGRTYAWLTGYRAIDFSVGGNEENWKNLRIIEDRLIKGSDVVSYIKNKENKILSGITQYILDIKYIDPAVKDAIFASLQTNTKSGPGRFEVGFYFVNANIAGQPDLKTYYNIVKTLQDKSKDTTLEPIQIAAQTLPYIDDLIKAGELNKKNAEITGGDWNPAGLLEAINWDDPYPYGKIDSIVTSTIKFYNPDFTDTDVKDAYSAFYGWLQKHEDLPDDMGVQDWYDNAVENFRDADQHERRGMDEDEEAAAEEGYIDAAENLLTQQLNAFFNGDSEEYRDFLNARALNKKNAEITGGDWNPAGLLENLQFDAGSEYFNYVDFCKEQGWSDKEIAEFSEWFATKSDMAEDINDYGDPEDTEAWWKVGSYFDAAIENAGYDAREHQDPTILLDHINDVKATIARYYRQYKDYKQAQALNQKNAAATGGDWEPEGLLEGEEICEQATLNPNGELRFGKYRIFQAGSGTQTAPYAQAINDTNLFSNRLATDVKSLETLGFKFDTVYYYQPPPRSDGKYVARAIAISGTDNNGEDIMWVRKGGFMAPSPAIYYKDSRAGDVKRMARLLSLQLKPANVVTVEDFLKAAVGPTGVTPKSGGWGYKSKKIKLRPDGKYDILGEVSLRKDYSYALVGKPFFINSVDDLPVKFGVIKGDLRVGLPVLNFDWFPEMVDGRLTFQEEAGMSPERFLEAGLLDRVTDNTEISFTTEEKDKYGFNKIKKFKSKADWIDTIKAHELNKKNAEITGGDWNPAGLLESWTDKDIEDYWEHYYNVGDPGPIGAIKNWPGLSFFNSWFVDMIDRENWNVDSIEDYFIEYSDRVADNLEQKDNEDRGYGELQEIACYRGYKKLYSYYRQFLLDTNSPFYKDWKATEELNKKNAAATGGDWNPAGLLESKSRNNIGKWVSIMLKAAEEAAQDPKALTMAPSKARLVSADFWTSIPPSDGSIEGIRENFLNAIKQAQNFDIQNGNFSPAKNKFKKMKYDPKRLGSLSSGYQIYVGDLSSPEAQKEIKKDFIYKANTALFYRMEAVAEKEYPGNRWYTIIGPLVETGNIIKDFIKGDLKEIKDFLKDYLDAQELDKKNAAATGGDWNPAGLLEQGSPVSKKPYITEFNTIITKAKDARTFNDFEAAFEGTDPNIWNTDTTGKFFHKVFVAYFNSEPLVEPLVKINSKNDYERTKFGHLYEAINHYGEYLLLSRTDAEADRFSGEDKRSEAAFVYKKQAENYFNNYIDIINAEELDKKNAAATGGDWNPAGLLEAYIWKGFPDEYLTDNFTKLIKKAAAANTFEEFLAAHDDVDPKIWSTARAEPFYFKIFQHIFNVDLYKNINGTRGTFIGLDTKLGALYRAIEKMGFYTVAAKTDHNPWHHNVGTKEYRIKSDLESAKKYFDTYKDIVDAEELNKKNAAATGGDWEPAGLLESNKVFNPEIYDIYKKALEANSFEEFKKLIKQLPDPWKYEVMVGGGANARAIIKDILELKDIPSSYSPKTPADHFLTAVDHIQDVEHSSSVTLDDIRSGYAYAQEHFAKWLDYKKAKELEQKNVGVTGGDWNPAGLLESQEQDNVTPERDKTLFFGTVENFKKYLPEISDADLIGFYDWFNNVKRVELGFGPHAPNNESSWGVFQQITYVAAEDEFGIPEHEIPDEFRSVAEMTMEKLYDEYKAHLVNKKNADVTGGDWNPAGLLQEANSVSHDKRFALMKWARAIPNSNEFARQWALKSGFSEEDIENFGGQEWLIDGLIDWFTDAEADKTKYQGGKIYDMSKLSLEQQIALYQKLEDDAVEEVKKHLEELYKDWMAAIELNKKNADVTGGDWDPKGLLEASTLALKSKEVKNAYLQKFVDLVDEASKCRSFREFEAVFKKADIEPSRLGHREEIRRAFRVLFDIDTIDSYTLSVDNGLIFKNKYGPLFWAINDFLQFNYHKNADKHLSALELNQIIRDIESYFHSYLDYIKAEELDQKNVADTGGDWNPAGLLEAKQYTGPLGPVKDKQGKEHDYQGWYNIIKPFIIDLLKAVENNDFSSFIKIVDSRQKNMGGPGFNPYFNLVDKVYAKVLMELLNNEQAENAFDEAYSTVQSMIVYIDVHLKGQWDRDPNTLQHIPHAQIKQEYPRAVAAFNKFKDFLDAKELDKKNAADTGGDWNPAGLLETKSKSTPEQDKYWGDIIYDYINKLVNANTFEEFMGLVEEKPATFQFNPGMYYHDKIFVNAIDSILGSHDKETGNPVRSSFVAAFSAIQGFVSYIDLFYNKEETSPLLEKHRAETEKKFDQWLQTRADWYAAQELNKKNAAATGGDWNPAGLLESEDELDDVTHERYWNNALDATATDWVNSFTSYIGLELANKIYTWMLNKARVEHDSQATYNNLIDMYGKFADERKKKDGLKNWVEPDTAKVLADIVDAYNADQVEQKNVAATGGDWDPKGLL